MAEEVKTGMLEGVEAALGQPKGSVQKPFYTRVHLWGAVLPTKTSGIPCIFDPHGRAGLCFDWLLGSNLLSAALSGMSFAHYERANMIFLYTTLICFALSLIRLNCGLG